MHANTRRWAAMSTVACLGIGMAGCAVVLVGAGAAGGYALSRDSVISHHDLPQRLVFQQSLAAIRELGEVTVEDAEHATIEARVDEAVVTVTVKPITEHAVELRVKARKNLMPAQAVAQKVYTQIIKRL